jgi:hypothetical protein
VVELKSGVPALLFSAAAGGVSGFPIRFALLRPGIENELEDMLGVSLSNQSQHAFWTEPSISDAKIFVTADYEWGPDEAHYDDHRYIISAYLFLKSPLTGDSSYYLQDRYMTLRKYDLESNDDVLALEKQEIVSRLLRVKQASPGLR